MPNLIKPNYCRQSSILKFHIMQKHQQWLDNRSYEQHLQCLKKIKARRNNSIDCIKKFRKNPYSSHLRRDYQEKQNTVSNLQVDYQSRQKSPNQPHQKKQEAETSRKQFVKKNTFSKFQPNAIQEEINCLSGRNSFNATEKILYRTKRSTNFQKEQPKDTTNISLKKQELMWDNFLLGKRILETSPVICKRKLDVQYRKHKQLVRSMTAKKMHYNSNFRLKKLKQHNDKIQKIQDDRRIENNLRKQYMVNLLIQSIQIFKYKFSNFQNIILVMKCGPLERQQRRITNQQKKAKQVSQCITSSQLTSYNFFFTLKKKKFQQNAPIIIQIKNVKSLNIISIGTFSYQFDNQRQIVMKQANLYNFGKLIGIVKFNANFGKKTQFLSKVE